MKTLLLTLLFVVITAPTYFFWIYYSKEQGMESSNLSKIGAVSSGVPFLAQDKSQPEEFVSNLSIDYLRTLEFDSWITIEEEIVPGSNYKRFIASYDSDGNKIYGLLTVPNEEPPAGGYSAIVFNHGYIPPSQYVTTEKYVAYVDYLARNGFVVFKIDMRGHGNSEGTPTGSYFSPGYSIDAHNALNALQKLEYINEEKIGMWGHSMAGNLVLRAMLISGDVKASVIWSGAVYSYEDFAKYRLNDSSYVPRQRDPHYDDRDLERGLSTEVLKLRNSPDEVDFDDEFWSSISLTKNLEYLNSPIQLHHAVDDTVASVNYSRDLASVLEENNKKYEFYEYQGGGHNIDSPYFEQAMQRTVEFFQENL